VGGAGHTAGGAIKPKDVKGADQKAIEKIETVKVKKKKRKKERAEAKQKKTPPKG
jgi:hypothetical protein